MNAVSVLPMEECHLNGVAAREAAEGDVHWSRAQFEKELAFPRSRFYVMMRQKAGEAGKEELLGYGGFWIVHDEAQVTNLLVAKAYRCQGFGGGLLQHLMGQAKQEGCARMTLEVRMNNAAARMLYEKAGFVINGRRPRAYSNPADDALLMEKQL